MECQSYMFFYLTLFLCDRTKISVFMLDRSSDSLINIANYGEEYQKSDEIPIKLLFHGYGHYDIVEVPNNN